MNHDPTTSDPLRMFDAELLTLQEAAARLRVSARSVRREIADGPIAAVAEPPEGCTVADAQMLRQANHGLADENNALRVELQKLVDQIEKFAEENGEADFYTGDALKLLRAEPVAPVASEEVEEACERLLLSDGFFDDVVDLIRQKAAQLAELQAKAQVQYGELIGGDDRRDAERYRWLRSEDAATNPRYYEFWQEFNAKLCREEKMDAAIDAAIAGKGTVSPPQS